MIHDYPFGKIFQLRLLAFLVRRPNEVAGIIEPRYFTHPVHVDIARVTAEAYKRHPKARVGRHTLLELMKADVSKNRIKDSWPLYKKEIRSIFRYKFDRSYAKLMLEQAVEFAKQERYRGALILAEKHVSNRCYDAVHEVFEKASLSLNGH